jgi:hypothetical protein
VPLELPPARPLSPFGLWTTLPPTDVLFLGVVFVGAVAGAFGVELDELDEFDELELDEPPELGGFAAKPPVDCVGVVVVAGVVGLLTFLAFFFAVMLWTNVDLPLTPPLIFTLITTGGFGTVTEFGTGLSRLAVELVGAGESDRRSGASAR